MNTLTNSNEETPLPPLHSATVCLNISTEVGISLDWRACVGLRGFIGRRLDNVPDSLRDLLLPLFHLHHENPAPFRMVLEYSDPENGVHRLRLLTFGLNSERILTCLTDLLDQASGELHSGDSKIRFQISQTGSFENGMLLFPGQEDSILQDYPRSVVVASISPFFSKTESEFLFSKGHWTELLAIRYADLAGIRRQMVSGKLPNLPNEADYQSISVQLSFGGAPRPRNGFLFRTLFPNPCVIVRSSLELLRCLGLGKHCAYGAGSFKLEPAHEFTA